MKLGIISDIHEDVVSLRKALGIINNKCDEIICLGDIIGYSKPYYNFPDNRNASECIELVRSNCDVVITGNHDLFAIKKLTSFTNGFKYPDNWFELDFIQRKVLSGDKIWLYEDEETDSNLTIADKEYIDSLSEMVVRDYGDVSILFSHYLYPDISGSEATFRYKKRELKQHTDFIKHNDCLLGISGHAHVDGIVSGTASSYKWKDYGRYEHKKVLSWIVVPCIASSLRGNGFLVFDTKLFEIEIIRL